ncbi:pre-toxin TG domain-containing protein [Streptomyces litchfieldiae]|uniref:Pre-toxin TG domain-containing protein n=1 Tax=Streptomyces litchfieldiae TaxID=3075543 RepID=A0ABU2N0W9_9ACTN|nr:hypothetical protein [Streptomyces sp. DSM 44938]MDT0346404.1 hypothetical protein [Streptomyces sp. DSM 44938]
MTAPPAATPRTTAGLGRYRSELADCERDLAQALLNSQAYGPVGVAIIRETAALMRRHLEVAPDSVLAFDSLHEDGRSGAALWRYRMFHRAWLRYDRRHADPPGYAAKYAEFVAFARLELARWSAEEVIRVPEEGIVYVVRRNRAAVEIMGVVLEELVGRFEHHTTEADFYGISPLDAYRRMLLERDDLLAALRLGQTLPLDSRKYRVGLPARPAWAEAVELGIGFIPVVGSLVAAYEAYSGKDLFGYPLSPVERAVLGASVLLPAAARLAKGGRALYSAGRMQRMYGREAAAWSRVLGSAERLSASPETLRVLRAAEAGVVARSPLSRAESLAVSEALETAALGRTGVPAAMPVVRAEVREAFRALAHSHPGIAELDELAVNRVLRRGANTDHVKGQLLEELLETQAARWLRDPAGLTALGLRPRRGPLEFIPGHLIRDALGRQLTDGMIALRRGGRLEVLVIFEAKGGQRAARELRITPAGREKSPELRAYAEDCHREVVERARLSGSDVTVSVEEIEAEIARSERGGQVRRDMERLVPVAGDDPTGRATRFTDIFIGGVSTPVWVSPRRTKIFGVVPRDVRPGRMVEDLRALGYDFEILGLPITQRQLTEAAATLTKVFEAL